MTKYYTFVMWRRWYSIIYWDFT